MLPLMDKDTVRYITLNITPEEAEYIAGIKSTIDDTCDGDCTCEKCDDIIFLTKMIAFYTKFKNMNWTIAVDNNNQYKMYISDFTWRLEQYKEDIAENILAIIGQIKGSDITKIELPVSDNPLEIINEIKICLQNWFTLHKDDIEYEGARSLTSAFLAQVHKFVYIFRLCKVSDPKYPEKCEAELKQAVPVEMVDDGTIGIGTITPNTIGSAGIIGLTRKY